MKINSIEDVKTLLEKIDVQCPDSDCAYSDLNVYKEDAIQSRINYRTELMYDAARACEYLRELTLT